MTKLKELGVDTSKASLRYVYLPTARSIFNETDELESEPTLFACNQEMLDGYPTFALQDVIELLPKRLMSDFGDADLIIQPNRDATVYVISYEPKNDIIAWFYDENILDAAYQMLIWVIENGYLKTK